jgi:hypothetical protein
MDKACPYGYTAPTEFYIRGATECPFLQSKGKYTLELTEHQANAMVTALEAFMRLGLTQFSNAIDLALPTSKLKGYDQNIEDSLNKVREILFNVLPNQSYSICSNNVTETVKIVHDIFEVIRHKLSWDKHPEGGTGVNFSDPFKTSNTEDLPKFTLQK